MACSYKFNGVVLSEDQYNRLMDRAVESLQEKKLNQAEELHPAQIASMVNELNISELNTENLIKLQDLNEELNDQYGTEEEYISINENGEITINNELIQRVNKDIQDTINMTPEMVESTMNDLLFNQPNGLTGFSSDPRVESRFEKVINYKQSMANRLETVISQIQVKKKQYRNKTSDPFYNKLLEAEKEANERLNGKGYETDSFYVPGLRREIKKLMSEGNMTILKNYLNSDLQRLNKLSTKNDIDSINEANSILVFFKALSNISPTPSNKEYENPVFSPAELKLQANQAVKEELKALANSVLNTYEAKIRNLEVQLLSETIKDDPDLQKLIAPMVKKIKEKRLKINSNDTSIATNMTDYEVFFKESMQDINTWDKYMMDGVIGTFSEFGQLTQLARTILEEQLTKFQSMDAGFTERMTTLVPLVNTELHKLGYGILGGLATSYKFFRQHYTDGKYTNKMVDRASAEFLDAWGKNTHEFKSAMKRAATKTQGSVAFNIIGNAYRNRDNWRREHTVLADPRKMQAIFGQQALKDHPEFVEFSRYFIDDGGVHEQELAKNMDSVKGLKSLNEDIVNQLSKYITEHARFTKNLLIEFGVHDIKDLNDEGKMQLERFVIQNNPFIAAQYFATGKPISASRGMTWYPKMTEYSTFIPRRFKLSEGFKTPITGEIQYNVGREETGYYDKNFKTIEENEVLNSFLELATEMMDMKKYLPLNQQRELIYNAIASKEKSWQDILLDKDIAITRRISPLVKSIYNQFVHQLSVKKGMIQEVRNTVDAITNHEENKVNSGFIRTNGEEIKRNFQLNTVQFIQTLKPGFARAYTNEKRGYRMNKYSVVNYSSLTLESKALLADYLDTGITDRELMNKLGITDSKETFEIGKIIYRDTVSKVIENETFNLPQALKLFTSAATLYAARNAAMPVIDLMRDHFKSINKPNVTNVGEEKSTSDTEKRTNANTVFDRWFNKNVLGNISPQVVGVLEKKLHDSLTERHKNKSMWGKMPTYAALSWDEIAINKVITEVIDRERAKPDGERNDLTIAELIKSQENIGRNFAMSAVLDRVLDVTRALGLGLNPMGATFNYAAGKISNFINATSGLYYKEDSHWRAEHLVASAHIKVFTERISKYLVPKVAKKIAIMMQRTKVFQDSSDEIYKATMDTATINPSMFNIYILQQTTEYVNQAPILVAYLVDNMIEGVNSKGEKITSTVWDALNENGKLKEGFNSEENKANWELMNSDDANKFITKVNETIKDFQGDYSNLGGSVYNTDMSFKILMMFKRWMSRYIHTRLGIEQYNQALGRDMKGRYRSMDAASAGAIGGVVALAILGPTLLVPATVIAAGWAAKVWGVKTAPNIITGNSAINYLTELALNLGQIAAKTVTAPLSIGYGVATGRTLLNDIGVNRMLSYGFRDNEIDNGNMNANLTEAGLVVMMLATRLIIKAVTKDRDEDEDDGLINLAINMCGRIMGDLTLFYNPTQVFKNLIAQPSLLRFSENLIKLADITSEIFFEGDDIVMTGTDVGASRFDKALQKVAYPALLRDDFGAKSQMTKITTEYGFDDFFTSDKKQMAKVVTNARVKYKAYLSEQFTKLVTPAMVKEVSDKILTNHPEYGETLAKRKAERYWKEEVKKAALKGTDAKIPTIGEIKKRFPDITKKQLNEMVKSELESNMSKK